jgi:hypothetical protein
MFMENFGKNFMRVIIFEVLAVALVISITLVFIVKALSE